MFLHIPRTAGTTLSSSLAQNYPRDTTITLNVLDRAVDEEIARIPLEERSKARLVWGHMPYGIHKYLPRRCEYITVLREPLARIVSGYKYILKNARHALHDRVVRGKISLEEYVESGMDTGYTENSQTRQLSGRQFGALDRQALAKAKHNLEGFLVVGLTERFEETFVLLRRTLRLRLPFYVTRNVSPPLEVSKRVAELVPERNELDLELYSFARDLFSDQIARQNRSFGFEVSALRAFRPLSLAAGAGGRTENIARKLSRTRATQWLKR